MTTDSFGIIPRSHLLFTCRLCVVHYCESDLFAADGFVMQEGKLG